MFDIDKFIQYIQNNNNMGNGLQRTCRQTQKTKKLDGYGKLNVLGLERAGKKWKRWTR